MTRKVFLILLALVLALSVGLACAAPGEEEEEEEQLSISDLKGSDWMQYVGTVVTVEGIFVRDPIPMLLTDLDIVKVNKPMPQDQYMTLVGDQAESIDPEEYGGAKLKLRGEVVAMDDLEKYWGEYVAIQLIDWEFLELVEEYNPPWLEDFPIDPDVIFKDRYAVLFSGGINWNNNHARYWNDLKFMYRTLINKYGYPPDHIWVLYANGSPATDPATGLPDTSMSVNYSATQANLELVFNSLKETTDSYDTIFVFTTNHGGGFEKDNLDDPIGGQGWMRGRFDADLDEPGTDVLLEADYDLDLNEDGDKTDSVSWDEELCAWGGSIYDDDFPNMFTNLEYKRMVIVMEQCFSGGLIADMAGPNRIIMSAASEYESSWAMDPDYAFDEFSYHFTCAINKADDQGNPVDADTDNDGKVSMVEAFNYAESEDVQPYPQWDEHPQYEDNGDGVPHAGPVPNGGDGTLGSNTFL